MFPFARILIPLAAIAAAGGAFLTWSRAESSEIAPPSNQAAYAEVPASATKSSPAAASPADTVNVSILVYHIVRPSYPSDDKAVRRLAQTPEVFDAQMRYLRDAGYHVISFGSLENYFKSGAPLPAKPIIISFDDGWRDQFEYAFPILEKYHYTATFFVFTNPIGTRGFLTWDELRTMRGAGMTIGSHSLSHPYLTKVADPAILWNEIYESKERLEKNLGGTVSEFAYPFGQYDPAIEALVKKAGYASARGDYYYGASQSAGQLYELSAMNVPTTTELFARKFPAR